MSYTNSDDVLHFKRKHMFNRKFFTFPMEDGAHLISFLDHHLMSRVRGITKFNDFDSQDVFYGVSSNSSGDKLKLIELHYKEPEMDVKHLFTIDDVSRVVVSDSCPFFIHRNDEGGLRLFRFNENHKKVEGRKLDIEFTGLKDFFVYKNFIYCSYHDSSSDLCTISRYDVEKEKVEFIWKTEKTSCRNFLLDKHKERILMLSARTLLLIDHDSLHVDTIECDIPYRPFYRLVSITSEGELTLSSRRQMNELFTATISENCLMSPCAKALESESAHQNCDNRIRELESRFAALERKIEYERQRKEDAARFLNDIE